MNKRIAIVLCTVITLGLACLGLILWFSSGNVMPKQNVNKSFDEITTKPSQAVSFVKDLKKTDQSATIVLVKKSCKDCQRNRKAIIKSVKNARTAGQYVLVFDADQLSEKQLDQIVQLVPSLISPNDNRVHTPTFTTVKPVHGKDGTFLMSTKTLIEGNQNTIQDYFDEIK